MFNWIKKRQLKKRQDLIRDIAHAVNTNIAHEVVNQLESNRGWEEIKDE